MAYRPFLLHISSPYHPLLSHSHRHFSGSADNQLSISGLGKNWIYYTLIIFLFFILWPYFPNFLILVNFLHLLSISFTFHSLPALQLLPCNCSKNQLLGVNLDKFGSLIGLITYSPVPAWRNEFMVPTWLPIIPLLSGIFFLYLPLYSQLSYIVLYRS